MTSEPPPQLCDRDAWTGGCYELSMQLGARDDVRLQAALGVLARAADVVGPWHVQWQPDRIRPVGWSVADLEVGPLRGQLQLPDGRAMICAMVGVRDDDGDDWLDLCIPVEALCRSDDRVGVFPFESDDSASLTWRQPIDQWFAQLAGEVRLGAGFRLAVVGFEVSGSVRAEKLSNEREIRPYALVLADGTYLPAGR